MFRQLSRVSTRFRQDLLGLRRVLSSGDFSDYLRAIVLAGPDVLRQRSLVPADDRMTAPTYDVDVEGIQLRVSGEVFRGVREMYARRVYTIQPECHLPASGWVVDAGANTGLFSTLAACGGLSVLAIEAQEGFRNACAQRLRLNGVSEDKVRWEAAFLGGGGVLEDAQTWAQASHRGSGSRPPKAALSSILDKHGIGEVELLKMDVEGSEYEIFCDTDWMARTKRITMEVHRQFGDPGALASTLTAHGFEVRLRDADLRPVAHGADAGYLYAWRRPS